jgi:hypothetical protein
MAARAQADHGACAGQQLVGGEVEERQGGREVEMLTSTMTFSSEGKSLRQPVVLQTSPCISRRGYVSEA